MVRQFSHTVSPEVAYQDDILQLEILKRENLAGDRCYVRILKKSIDARMKHVVVHVKSEVFIEEVPEQKPKFQDTLPNVSNADPVVIVGAGPAGLFAALELVRSGFKPIVIERGKDVRARRRDIAALNKDQQVNIDSNYCFGEGGAGTYSDGKLYTRSKKRGDIDHVLRVLVDHGAKKDILYDSHPHIGTNKLPPLIQAMRETLVDHGAEIHFDCRVDDFEIKDGRMTGVNTQSKGKINGRAVILATGHSARDIYELLSKKNIQILSKPFALGVRIEHPQSLINKKQYSSSWRDEYLPSASYALKQQVDFKGKEYGVFSFCMCPGGFIVPAATGEGEVVVNGMSPSRRNSKFANSGIVVTVGEDDFKTHEKSGALRAMEFQKAVEKRAFESTTMPLSAPAQRVTDFIKNKASSGLPECSYQPGLESVNLVDILPKKISHVLKQGFKSFDKRIRGYISEEAVILGVESRTSAPVIIPRDKITCEHTQIENLYPCGEGAGYAGGIMSAALDGMRVASQISQKFKGQVTNLF